MITTNGRHYKPFEELTITDDFMFCKVFSTRLDLTKELLERILDVKIKEIKLAESQRTIDIVADGKSVRFDVYVEDDENSIYDIEMQTTFSKDLRKRSRYYQGMLDLSILGKGISYKDLRKSFVIFLCTFDLFGHGLPIYTFERRCMQDESLALGDDTRIVFVNATALSSNPLLQSLFDYINTGETNDSYTESVMEAVSEVAASKKWRVEYMTLQMKLEEEFNKGKKEGQVEGVKKERVSVIRAAFVNGDFSVEKLASILNYSEEEVEAALRTEPSLIP